MSLVTQDLRIQAWQAGALFAPGLQRSDGPGTGQVRRAVAAAPTRLAVAGSPGRPVRPARTGFSFACA